MKTEQQKRFEAAYRVKFQCAFKAGTVGELLYLAINPDTGKYANAEQEREWQCFQLGEASALERALEICIGVMQQAYDAGHHEASQGANTCSERISDAIRALAQEGK